jgi:MFS family permease
MALTGLGPALASIAHARPDLQRTIDLVRWLRLARDLVAREQRAQAISLMFAGLTLANVLGVPFGTALGQAAGWRAAFWAVVAMANE